MVYCLITCLVTGYSFPSPSPFLLFPAMVFTPHFDYLAGNKVYCMFWSRVVCSLLVQCGELGLPRGRRWLQATAGTSAAGEATAQGGTRTETGQFLLQRRESSQEPPELCSHGHPQGHGETTWTQKSRCRSSELTATLSTSLAWTVEAVASSVFVTGSFWLCQQPLAAGFSPLGMDVSRAPCSWQAQCCDTGALWAFLHTAFRAQQLHSRAVCAGTLLQAAHSTPARPHLLLWGFAWLCFGWGAEFCAAVPPSWWFI